MKYLLSWFEYRDGEWRKKSKVIAYLPKDDEELANEIGVVGVVVDAIHCDEIHLYDRS